MRDKRNRPDCAGNCTLLLQRIRLLRLKRCAVWQIDELEFRSSVGSSGVGAGGALCYAW